MSLYVYFNPKAGSGRAAQQWQEVQHQLLPAHVTWVELPEQPTDLPDASDILVIGGDGTFNQLLNRLPQPEKYRFILLPAGTSNSLCSQISPALSCVEKTKRYLQGAAFRKVDVGELTTNKTTYRFINEASVGFAAAIAREMERNNRCKRFFNALHLNELSYIAIAFRCWAKEHPYFLSLCNNRRISGNLYPCPNARLDDGTITSYELRCPRWRLPLELCRLIRNTRPIESPYVQYTQFTEHLFHFDHALPIEIDGNPLPPTTEVKVGVYPHSITLF